MSFIILNIVHQQLSQKSKSQSQKPQKKNTCKSAKSFCRINCYIKLRPATLCCIMILNINATGCTFFIGHHNLKISIILQQLLAALENENKIVHIQLDQLIQHKVR